MVKHNVIIGGGTLDSGLFKLDLNLNLNHSLTTMHGSVGIKHGVINEKSFMLWHKRIGHISIEIIKRLVSDGVLKAVYFANLDICMDCIKRKHTNISKKKSAMRTFDVLEIVHTKIYDSHDMCLNGQRYFITFIGDYSHYMHLFLLYDKSEALDAFKIYKEEVEKQLGKQIKIVKSNISGEHYGRYIERRQLHDLFGRFH